MPKRWVFFGGSGAAPPSTPLWLASSLALPSGAFFVRSGSAWGLEGATYATAVYTVHGTDSPRFERLPSEKIGLLIEKARTNQIESGDTIIGGTFWASSEIGVAGTFTANDSASRLSGALADKFVFPGTTADGQRSIFYRGTIAVANPHCYSLWAKGTGDFWANISGYTSSSHMTLSSTYQRLWEVRTISGDQYFQFGNDRLGGGTLGYSTSTVTATVSCVQVEDGPFPTSYIDTTGSVGFRNADLCEGDYTVPSSGFALALEARTALGTEGDQYLVVVDGGASNRVAIRRNSSGAIVLDVLAGGTMVAQITGATVANDTEFKVSASIAANSFGLCVNDTVATRDTSGALPTGLNAIRYGYQWSVGNQWCGHLISGPNGVDWLTPKTDAELLVLNGVAPWTPLALLATSSGIWLDTTDATKVYSDAGVTLATSGGVVGRVVDKNATANGNQTTTASKPLWTGAKLLDFDLVDDFLLVTAATAINDIWATGGSLVCVVEVDSLGEGAIGRIGQKSSGANGWQYYLAFASGATYKLRFDASRVTQKGEWTMVNFDLTAAKTLVELYYDGSSTGNSPTLFLNGVSSALTNTTAPIGALLTDASNDLYLGNRFDNARTWDGRLGSFFIMKSIPSDPDKAKLRTYIGAQHGLTL